MKDSEAHGRGGAVFSKSTIGEVMGALPFVTWDRWATPSHSCGTVYGWINYPDRERDFVVLQWDSAGLSFVTSSEAHVEDLAARLGEVLGRRLTVTAAECHAGRRVEEDFGDIVSRLGLVAGPPGGEGDPKPSQVRLFGDHGGRYLEGA